MTDPLPDDRSLRYLLGEMTPEEEAELRAQVAEDLEEAERLRAAGDALHAWVRPHLPAIEPPPRLWNGIRRQVTEESRPATGPQVRPAKALAWWNSLLFWRVAALLFLALHVGWLGWWLRPTPAHPSPVAVATGPGEATASADATKEVIVQNGATPGADAAGSRPEADSPGTLRERLEQQQTTIAHLQEALDQSHQATRQAERERDLLASRMDAFFQPHEGKGQLTVIELHPEGSASRGLVRDLQHALLDPSSQLVLAEDLSAGRGAWGAFTMDAGSGDPVVVDDQGRRWSYDYGTGQWVAVEPTPSAPPAEESGSTEGPAALAIWRPDLQQGFLNLYGLPTPAEGNHFTLWVREGENAGYVPVGVLPDPNGNVLLIDFTVGDPLLNPSEILVTEEPEADDNAEGPSGTIILRGP